jgi:hypothetical protein
MIARWSVGADPLVIGRIDKETFGAESLERPALIRGADGGWRVYLSCATPGSKHWWIESLSGAHPEDLPDGLRRMEFPGDATTGVKDPVLRFDRSGVRAWVCCHPLDEPGHEDRMTTRHMTSSDGLTWEDRGVVLRGRPGQWDERGARVTAVLAHEPLTVLYDGRPDAASNWYERTGVAGLRDGELRALPDVLIGSPYSDGALRYACAVPLPDGRTRFYFEAARADGAHDLLTSVG